MNITINTNDRIDINGRHSGFGVRQENLGTVVWSTATGKEVKMPHRRYSLVTDKPLSGCPGRADFERDLLVMVKC